jgi:hypothetical protein
MYHIASRVLGKLEKDVTDAELAEIAILRETLYRHKVCRINYTSYDLRRSQDSINPRTHADIMLLDPNGDANHPFWFARVIGIFHVNVSFRGKVTLMHLLWVRWFGTDYKYKSGFKHRRLPRIGFLANEAMGFVNPDDVIRAAHIIPAFAHGRSDAYLDGPSIARIPEAESRDEDDDQDWVYYYVDM